MQNLREVFERMTKQKEERKKIQAMLTDVLKSDETWVRMTDEIKAKRTARKLTEDALLSGFTSERERLDRLDLSIKTDAALVSDIALSMYIKGQSIDLETERGKYEPRISVSFKQMKLL